MSLISLDWYWFSFRRPDYQERKEGRSNLGVAIVEAAGPHGAFAKVQQLGLRPVGSQVKCFKVPAPPEKYRNRLLSPEEAAELNLVTKEALS